MQIINDHQKCNELKCCYSIEIKQTPKQLIHPSHVSSNGYCELEIYKNCKNTIAYCAEGKGLRISGLVLLRGIALLAQIKYLWFLNLLFTTVYGDAFPRLRPLDKKLIS